MLKTLPVLSVSAGEPAETTLRDSAARAGRADVRPTCAFLTLGCKINQYETEAVREEIEDLGYRIVPPGRSADVYVVNTCSVTHRAGVKSRKLVQRVARNNPSCRIIVMGCSSPQEKDALRRVPQVAVLAGNEEKGMIGSFLGEGIRPGELVPRGPIPALRVPRKSDRSRAGSGRDIMDLSIARFEGRTRGYVKIQDGCNSFCSFCIIPFLRGLSRSRSPESVLAEASRLGRNGFREIVLAGIHLQDFGDDLAGEDWNLARLLRELRDVARDEGIWRIRLSSIGVQSFTAEMVDVLTDPLFSPHWHIPLQSGDDGVLRSMRRDYTRGEFLDCVHRLREIFDRPSVTTDVIVGHPGEDEAAFDRTVDVCREARFAKIHLFPFSPREGTRSASLAGRVQPEVIRERMNRLAALERDLALEYKRQFVDEVVEVLVEGPARDGGPADRPVGGRVEAVWLEGFTERYIRVRFPAPARRSGRGPTVETWANRICNVRLTTLRPEVAVGEPAGQPAGGGESEE